LLIPSIFSHDVYCIPVLVCRNFSNTLNSMCSGGILVYHVFFPAICKILYKVQMLKMTVRSWGSDSYALTGAMFPTHYFRAFLLDICSSELFLLIFYYVFFCVLG
jgi:hypothetical protein